MSKLTKGIIDPVLPRDDMFITNMSEDSRSIKPNGLFFALRGLHHHGMDFIAEALAHQATAVFSDEKEQISLPAGIARAYSPGLRAKMGLMADRFYNQTSRYLDLIAVTGTDGKTSVCHFICQALSHLDVPNAIVGSLGIGKLDDLIDMSCTTPNCLLMHQLSSHWQRMGKRKLVFEASSHGLDQDRLSGLDIDVAVLTNVSQEHLDYHGSFYQYIQTKRRLFQFDSLRYAVINVDDPVSRDFLETCRPRVETVTYSAAGNKADIYLEEANETSQGIALTCRVFGKQFHLQIPLYGHFNIENVFAAWGALLTQKLPQEDIIGALSKLYTPSGRMQFLGGEGKPTVVIDYAHTPQALSMALSACRRHTSGKLACVFGCGGDRDHNKRAIMGSIANHLADQVYITDDNPRFEEPRNIIADILSGIKERKNVEAVSGRKNAIQKAISLCDSGDLILVAGKGSETAQIIKEEKMPFSDQATVQDCLNSIEEMNCFAKR